MTRTRIVPSAQGNRDFGAVSASYVNLVADVPGRGVIIVISNTLNNDVFISLDGGTTDFLRLPAATPLVLDLGANGVEFSGTVSVRQGTGASTSGFISCGIVRSQ